MKAFTIQRIGRIRNKWITDGLSEVISTFILAYGYEINPPYQDVNAKMDILEAKRETASVFLPKQFFVYASGAQSVLSHGVASSVVGRALASSCGLSMAVYCGFNASGACVNPAIALMFCLTGKLPWKRWPLYAICELLGAFLAACATYGIYYELIDIYEAGERTVYGQTATAHIFTSFPMDGISKGSGFVEVAVGCGLLTSLTCMMIDPTNSNPANGLIPVVLTFVLFPILLSVSFQCGAPINLTIDFGGRFLAYLVYGTEVYTRANYWFWVPPVACITGTLVAVFLYQLMVGNHLPVEEEPIMLSDDNTNQTSDTNISKLSVVSDKL